MIPRPKSALQHDYTRYDGSAGGCAPQGLGRHVTHEGVYTRGSPTQYTMCLEYGLPMRCLRGYVYDEYGSQVRPPTSWAIPVLAPAGWGQWPAQGIMLPLQPILPGIVINAVCFALPLVTVPLLRRAWRRASGRCGVCGYDVRGIAGACPECGLPPGRNRRFARARRGHPIIDLGLSACAGLMISVLVAWTCAAAYDPTLPLPMSVLPGPAANAGDIAWLRSGRHWHDRTDRPSVTWQLQQWEDRAFGIHDRTVYYHASASIGSIQWDPGPYGRFTTAGWPLPCLEMRSRREFVGASPSLVSYDAVALAGTELTLPTHIRPVALLIDTAIFATPFWFVLYIRRVAQRRWRGRALARAYFRRSYTR